MNSICAINHIGPNGLVCLSMGESLQFHDASSLRLLVNAALCVRYGLDPNPCPTGGLLKAKSVYLINDPNSVIGLRKDMRTARLTTLHEKEILTAYLALLRHIFPNESAAHKIAPWVVEDALNEHNSRERSEQIKAAITEILGAAIYQKTLLEFLPKHFKDQRAQFLLPEKEHGDVTAFLKQNAGLIPVEQPATGSSH